MSKSLILKDKEIINLDTEFFVDGKWVEQVRYNFPHCKGMLCQGLMLIHKRKTGAKKIILDYWLNIGTKVLDEKNEIDWDKSSNWKKNPDGRIVWGISKRFVMGNYHKDSFKVKHIEEKVADLFISMGVLDNEIVEEKTSKWVTLRQTFGLILFGFIIFILILILSELDSQNQHSHPTRQAQTEKILIA